MVGRVALVALAGATSLGAAVTDAAGATRVHTIPLVGTFALTAGTCNAKTQQVAGSYFRLVFPGGSGNRGPFFMNADSLCSDKTYTILAPGYLGGLVTGSYQPNPTPVFDRKGNARANSVVRPVSFTGINLSLSTNQIDPQTGHKVPPPSIGVGDRGALSGQLEAFSAAWNQIFINQGSPKPGRTRPGTTTAVRGTYNPKTRAFVMTWTSQVVKGRFNQFIGYWHLAGTFVPTGGQLPQAPSAARPRTLTSVPRSTRTTTVKATATSLR
jgi:hypothetical protein